MYVQSQEDYPSDTVPQSKGCVETNVLGPCSCVMFLSFKGTQGPTELIFPVRRAVRSPSGCPCWGWLAPNTTKGEIDSIMRTVSDSLVMYPALAESFYKDWRAVLESHVKPLAPNA